MTFYPKQGTYSREDFDSSDGAIFSNSSLQGIVGGYVSLLSTLTGTSSVIRTWKDVTNWSLSNGLFSNTLITGTFNVLSGNIRATQTNTVTGSYGNISIGGAWAVTTDYPAIVNGSYSGQGTYGLLLTSGSPNNIIYNFYSGGGQAITFEFDVASTLAYSGLTSLGGFSTTQNNLTGLPPLTGVVGHGLLFSNGTRWDYIEVTPYGVRSLNHPEIAIPIDMTTPKRVRVGFRGYDLMLSTEDGRSVVGYNKFDKTTTPGQSAFALFGAATKEGAVPYASNVLTGTTASYGRTIWDNIKILTGDVVINSSSGIDLLYSTGYVSMYTSTFNPGIAVTKYLTASIGYVPFAGGTTQVYTQYSGLSGWVDHNLVTLTGTGPSTINLNSIPIYTYPRQDFGIDYVSNPIRFKINQKSTLGNLLPPAVEYIELFADKDKIGIDLIPDWKLSSSTKSISVSIDTGTFQTDDPVPERWTSLLVNVPTTTGIANTFYDESRNIPISIVGTGEIVLEGPFRSSFKTYVDVSLSAITGSAAFSYFGTGSVYNTFPNPLFAEGFRTVSTGDTNFFTGLTQGKLANNTRISRTYAGQYKVDYVQESVYRPESQGRQNRINTYMGRTTTPGQEYLQGVFVYATSPDLQHDGTVGIEAVVPSGIASGNLLVSFDLQIADGSGIALSLIGSTTGTRFLPGESFRNFRTVTIPTTTTSPSEFSIRFNVPSGYPGDPYKYRIDNLTVGSYTNGYLQATGISGYTHSSGIAPDYISYTVPYQRASTIAHGHIYLNSYPTSTGYFLVLTGANNRGLSLAVDFSGYLTANIDHISNSWAPNSSTGMFQTMGTTSLTSMTRVPLGRWTHLGFMHDVHTYSKFSYSSISGNPEALNFASANRAYLTIDGYPVANKDLMTGWKSNTTTSGDANPFATYIDLTGNVTAKIASGLNCYIDGVHVLRPPVSDVETELTIKGARAGVPYFVPDSLFQPNNESNNLLYKGPQTPSYGKDIYIGSIYNFSSPFYTNWDRGPTKNHLLYYGTVSKELNSPYTGQNLYSTRFNGGVAIAPYSSSYERLQSTLTQNALTFSGYTGLNQGAFSCHGWIYPRTTGSFFTYYQQSSNLTGSRLELSVNSDRYIVLNKYNSSSNTVVYSNTGQQVSLSGWSFVAAKFVSTGYNNNLGTGVVTSYIGNETGIYSYTSLATGVDYGIFYQGRTGSVGSSQFMFGGTSDVNLFNWVLPIHHTGATGLAYNYNTQASKSGRYQAMMIDQSFYTGSVSYQDYSEGSFTLGPTVGNSYKYISIALLGTYDYIPKLNGIVAFDNKPFKEIGSYFTSYNTEAIETIFGSTDSPIRIGNQVPASAINLAKINSPSYDVKSSITTLDLSDSNTNNLVTYKEGTYTVGDSVVSRSSITGYKGINSNIYSGRADITLSGQIVSADIEVSTIPITNLNSDQGYPAYYYYLIGRGSFANKVLGANPHYTGQISEYTTGSLPDNYTANLEKIKSSIKLKTRNGDVLPFDTYPYDIAISSYTPDTLTAAISSLSNVGLDNIGDYYSGEILPNEVFSVILLTHTNKIEGKSVFVHYDAYDLSDGQVYAGRKEVINPQPIYREKLDSESAGLGKFNLTLNTNNYYDLTLYAIASGLSGKL